MGLFDKIKNVLFEEEEVEETEVVRTPVEEKPVQNNIFEEVREYKPIPEHNIEHKVKEPTFEKVNVEENNVSERELFKSDSTFKFPAFDEDEFNTSMPHTFSDIENSNSNFSDFDFPKKKKLERTAEYSRFDSSRFKEEVKEEKKRFKPSPVISPVYGILDKDYKAEDIVEVSKDANGSILTSKDLDVESVRAKAFGKLDNIAEKRTVKKTEIKTETYTLKDDSAKKKISDVIDDVIISDEPILEDSSKLMEERSKTIDELLKDASDNVIDAEKELEEFKELDIVDKALDEDVIDDDNAKESSFENDTLENDLYDLIDSMYDNTEDGE